MDLLTKLNRHIETSGLKVRYIYENVGVSRAQLSNIRSGKTQITLKRLLKLCNVLKLPPAEEKELINLLVAEAKQEIVVEQKHQKSIRKEATKAG